MPANANSWHTQFRRCPMNGAPIHHRIPHGSRNPKSGRGVAGAFIGGLHRQGTRPGDPIDGFFDFSTWLGASIGSIVLLLIYRALAAARGRGRTAY